MFLDHSKARLRSKYYHIFCSPTSAALLTFPAYGFNSCSEASFSNRIEPRLLDTKTIPVPEAPSPEHFPPPPRNKPYYQLSIHSAPTNEKENVSEQVLVKSKPDTLIGPATSINIVVQLHGKNKLVPLPAAVTGNSNSNVKLKSQDKAASPLACICQ